MIIKALTDRIDVMYADPPNADVSSVCAPGDGCAEVYTAQLGDMSNQKVHYENYPPITVLSVDNVVDVAATSHGSIASGTLYEITYTAQGGDFTKARIVDAEGNVVADLAPPEGSSNVVSGTRTLIWYGQDPELPWRFVD